MIGGEHTTQNTTLEFPESEVRERFLGERSTFLSGGLNYNPAAGTLFDAHRRIPRSEPRATLNAQLWITSLHKPGVFEIVPTEDVSRTGIRLVAQTFWEPDELVIVSSPPGLCREGSVVYCRKLPSDDYALGIRLSAPVEHWIKTLKLATP